MNSRFILLAGLALGGGAASAATVQGLVADAATAQPIAGARVTVVYRPGLLGSVEAGSASTGADGRYVIDLPGFGAQAIVVAAAPGRAARNQSGQPCMAPRDCFQSSTKIPIGGGVTTVDFDLVADAHVGGRIVDFDSGASVGLGTLTLEQYGWDQPGDTRAEIAPNADGTFRFDGLHAGQYKLVARTRRSASNGPNAYLGYVWPDEHCDDVVTRCDAIVTDALTVAAGDDPAALTLRVRKGAYVRSRLLARNSNQPIGHAAMLHWTTDPTAFVSGNDIGSADGYAYVGPVFAGSYKLVLGSARPGYMSVAYPDTPCAGLFSCDLAAAQPIGLADGQLFTAEAYANPARSIAGRITEWLSNRPLAGVRVSAGDGFSTLPDANGQWGFGAAHSAVTDADGRYLIEGIDAEAPIVRTFYSHAGFMDYAWPLLACRGANLYCNLDTDTYERVDLVAQPHRTGIDVELSFGNAIRGRVEYPDGSPAPNYFVAVIPFQANRVAPPVRSGADGAFRLEGLGPDRHYLVASRQPIAPDTHVTLRPLLPCYIRDMADMPECDLDEARITTLDPGEIVEGLQFVVPFEDDTIFRSGFEQ